jgi:hypothetical protein
MKMSPEAEQYLESIEWQLSEIRKGVAEATEDVIGNMIDKLIDADDSLDDVRTAFGFDES